MVELKGFMYAYQNNVLDNKTMQLVADTASVSILYNWDTPTCSLRVIDNT